MFMEGRAEDAIAGGQIKINRPSLFVVVVYVTCVDKSRVIWL